MEAIMEKTAAMCEAQAAGEQFWIGAESDGAALLIQSESGDVVWLNGGVDKPSREEPENSVYARRMVAAWNACQGIPTEALRAARTGAVASVIAPLLGKNPSKALAAMSVVLSLVREAAAPGGIGQYEFSRPGGWRQRANEALNSLGAVCVEEQTEVEVLLSVAGRVLPFHLFDIQAESSEGTMRYFVSAAGKNQESAQQDAIQQVLCDLDEADSRADAVIRNVEYLGTSEREFCNVVGPCEGAR